jgi:hypothetical protein
VEIFNVDHAKIVIEILVYVALIVILILVISQVVIVESNA